MPNQGPTKFTGAVRTSHCHRIPAPATNGSCQQFDYVIHNDAKWGYGLMEFQIASPTPTGVVNEWVMGTLAFTQLVNGKGKGKSDLKIWLAGFEPFLFSQILKYNGFRDGHPVPNFANFMPMQRR